MIRHEHLRAAVERERRGPEVAALFDLDGTLIAGFSIVAFWRDRVLRGETSWDELLEALRAAIGFQAGQLGFSGFLAAVAAGLRGREEKELEETGQRLFEEELATLIYPEARELTAAHRERGHTLGIVSSATRYQVEPVARELEIEHVMCSELEVQDGRFTGRVVHPTVFRAGKAVAARALADRIGLDLSRSFFYTDSVLDLPLLREVGHPWAVNPDGRLENIARSSGWPSVRFRSRGTPTPIDWLRTGLAFGVMSAGIGIATPAALLNRNRAQLLNTAIGVSTDLGAALAGIDLQVSGEQHLWSHRPAVFIFNHQSAIDGILVGKMLRRDFVSVAKQEIRSIPLVGSFARLAGTIFIDRGDHAQAVRALEPAVEALRSGTSLVIAPEGTRSPTPRLGPFKKGAFRLAMAAGVPIVPIVFQNTLDAMPKHALVVRPATVEATVLPPIPTCDWRLEDLNTQIARVRRLYLETLAQREPASV